ncbi:MAG: pyridoxal phosphate-dependent aminotransferase [Gemmatimonadaceae bacterium]|nr:pyridoxal phosphate-dependent aminotransferase [Gemmatimonadaceae bacterium]
MSEAASRGYTPHHPDWANLGQGQPETGPLPGAPPRVGQVAVHLDDLEYAPVNGIPELRSAVAALYNTLYRQGMKSQYTADNVCICGGGRLSLTRTVAALGAINLGHFLPDYTAYEELLEIFSAFTAIPILLDPANGYRIGIEALEREVLGRGLGALLLSNPSNPTGKVIAGRELERWVALGRDTQCTMIFDEFYSHYVWSQGGASNGMVSAAQYVKDVNRDPVVILDGFTKNWRYPGWRTTWVLGPRAVIEAVSSTGSFLDGGGSRPLQRAAVPLLDPEHVKAETDAIRACFAKKRRAMLDGLRDIGVRFDAEPDGTFYCWGDLSALPAPLNDGMQFFRWALEHQVICVPGEFFDINPGKRRSGRGSRFRQYARFSFGPELDVITSAMERLRRALPTAAGAAKSFPTHTR